MTNLLLYISVENALEIESRISMFHNWMEARARVAAFFFQFWDSLISQVMSVVICFSSHYIIVYLSTWTPSYLPACSLCFRFFFLACFVLEWKTAEGGEIIKRELLTFKLRYLIELISFLLIADVTMFYVCYCRRVSNDKCDMKYNSIHEE